jgi:hypothetical protein
LQQNGVKNFTDIETTKEKHIQAFLTNYIASSTSTIYILSIVFSYGVYSAQVSFLLGGCGQWGIKRVQKSASVKKKGLTNQPTTASESP